MAKEELIELDGIVDEVLPDSRYRVTDAIQFDEFFFSPVSYTHLDVYKRQVQRPRAGLEGLAEHMSFDGVCHR